MEFAKRYIVQCISHSASNLRLRGEGIECLSVLKNYIQKCDDPENLFLEMKKVTSLARIGIKLNEVYVYASSDRIEFAALSKYFTKQSAELTSPLMFLLNDTTVENLLYQLGSINDNLKKTEPAEPVREKEEETLPAEELINAKNKFNLKFLPLIKELNVVLDELKKNKIEESKIKHYITLLEEKITLSEKAGTDIITKVLSIAVAALSYLIEFPEESSPEIIERIRSAFIVAVAILRGKDIDICYYLSHVDELAELVKTK